MWSFFSPILNLCKKSSFSLNEFQVQKFLWFEFWLGNNQSLPEQWSIVNLLKSYKLVTHPLVHFFLLLPLFLFCFNLPAPFMINWNRLRILPQRGETLLDLSHIIKNWKMNWAPGPISSNLAKGGTFENYFLGAHVKTQLFIQKWPLLALFYW